MLEYKSQLLLDIDPAIEGFSAQPERFRWTDSKGRRRSYTPDIRYARVDGDLRFLQVKAIRDLLADPDFGGRLPEIEEQCRLRGAEHEIWTEFDIERQPRLKNAKRIRSCVSFLGGEVELRLLEALPSLEWPSTVSELSAATGGGLAVFTAILGLVARRLLSLDIDEPIVPQTKLWPGGGAYS